MKLNQALEKFIEHLTEGGSGTAHLKTIRWRIGRFVAAPVHRGDREVDSVSRAELAQFFREYKETHSDGSMAGMTASHRQFWRFCKKRKWLQKNPAKRLRSYSYAPMIRRPPPEADVQQVAAALTDFVNHREQHPADVRDALFVSLSLDCGGRRGAMLKLKRSEVVRLLAGGGRVAANGRVVYVATVSRDKTGAATLEFFEETAALFRRWFELSPARRNNHDRIFVSTWSGKPIHPDTVSRAFERICKFAGVPVFRPHGVRKRNGREMIRNSDAETARQYTGHKDIQTLLEHYNQVEEKDVHNAAAEMASRRRGEGDRLAKELFRASGEGER